MCKQCSSKPVYVNQAGVKLCKKCFCDFIEKKVFKTIRQYKLIEERDKIAVGVSGGKDSLTCLHLIRLFAAGRNIEVFAVAIDEGIEPYRELTLKDAEVFCRSNKIPLRVFSFKKEFGITLTDFAKKNKLNPCSACGVMRRYALNKAARELKATKLATGHNLDDEAQSIFMNMIKGNLQFSAKLGPKTGIIMHKKFIPRIKPLYFITEQETTIYSKLMQFPVKYNTCPNAEGAFRLEIGSLLNSLEAKFPGTKNSIIQSFLEVLPILREKYQNVKIGSCEHCGEPAAKKVCRVCELLEKSKNKNS